MRNLGSLDILYDHGPEPFVVNIDMASLRNRDFRTALWTGDYLQATLMSIPVGGEIGLEMHETVDQFLRIESGHGLVKMGPTKEDIRLARPVDRRFAVIVPAGTWHNLINIGPVPLKLYSIYAPPNHPFGTVHETKKIAEKSE